MIKPQESGRHYFWANFKIPKKDYGIQIGRLNGKEQGKHRDKLLSEVEDKMRKPIIRETQIPELMALHGFDLSEIAIPNKRQVLRNCVIPELGLDIFNSAFNVKTFTQDSLFAGL